MAASKSRLPDHQRAGRPPGIIKRVLAGAGAGGGSVAGAVYLLFVQHVPFTSQAGIFEDLVAVIVLIALIAAAIIALTVSLDRAARSRLLYRAGLKAVDTVQSNAQALKTYDVLHSSLSLRWLRSLLGLPDGPLEGGDGGTGAGEDDEDKAV